MLTRERVALRVLEEAGGSMGKTKFVKLMFLLRMETKLKQYSSFYDFVPYMYGPFSFALYRDLDRLESYGYVSQVQGLFTLNTKLSSETRQQTSRLARRFELAIANILKHYGQTDLSPLICDIYRRYRWYALNSGRPERELFKMPSLPKASPGVYTIGYEGRSVDSFFNYLLERGIETIIDVRANPVSRKFGFAGSRMKQISENLGLSYCHCPTLGISSGKRANLSNLTSRAQLFAEYEQTTLVDRHEEVRRVGNYMEIKPSVLVCIEKDVDCCHRSRLATAVAEVTGMEVINL